LAVQKHHTELLTSYIYTSYKGPGHVIGRIHGPRGRPKNKSAKSGNVKTRFPLGSMLDTDIYFVAFFGRFSVGGKGAQKSRSNTAKNISGKIFDPVPFFVSDPPTRGVSDFFFLRLAALDMPLARRQLAVGKAQR
jgi:hypothetical protein